MKTQNSSNSSFSISHEMGKKCLKAIVNFYYKGKTGLEAIVNFYDKGKTDLEAIVNFYDKGKTKFIVDL